jgi:hypothetical protein
MSMIRCLSFLLLVGGFDARGQAEEKGRIANHLKALSSAPNNATQDSLSAWITLDLRTLLDKEGALSDSFADLPMTRVDAPDGAFRLFTWNLPRADGSHLYNGMLLVRTAKGQALYELRDMTSKIPAPEVPELGPDRWYGALYYEVVPVKSGSRTLYTLLGWKGYSRAENRKVIEVLSFKGGKPRFGAPVFGTGKLKAMRKVYAYAHEASMTLRYDASVEGIIMDHLSPSRPDMVGQPAFYGPDMTHDAYFWHKGEWWFGPQIDLRDPGKNVKPFRAPNRPASVE